MRGRRGQEALVAREHEGDHRRCVLWLVCCEARRVRARHAHPPPLGCTATIALFKLQQSGEDGHGHARVPEDRAQPVVVPDIDGHLGQHAQIPGLEARVGQTGQASLGQSDEGPVRRHPRRQVHVFLDPPLHRHPPRGTAVDGVGRHEAVQAPRGTEALHPRPRRRLVLEREDEQEEVVTHHASNGLLFSPLVPSNVSYHHSTMSLLQDTEYLFSVGAVEVAVNILQPVAHSDPLLLRQYVRALLDIGRTDEAVCILLDVQPPSLPLVRACQAAGFASLARTAAVTCLALDVDSREIAYLLGIACMDECHYSQALRVFDSILETNPLDAAYYKRELCRWALGHASDPGAAPDASFSRVFKLADVAAHPVTLDLRCHGSVVPVLDAPPSLRLAPLSPDETALCDAADRLGTLFVLDSPGFAHNRRLCRAMALAAFEAANGLRSRLYPSALDFMDVFVRWRRIAAAADSVWWVLDGHPTACLRTPLCKRSRPVFRYRTYLQRVLALIAGGNQSFVHPRDCYAALGHKDTVVRTACDLPGSELHIVASENEIDVFSHTALDAERVRTYLDQLETCFRALCQRPSDLRLVCRFAYVWFNFQCLSRGASVCGHAALVAFLLVGDSIHLPLRLSPPNVQWDWESLLSSEAPLALERHLLDSPRGPEVPRPGAMVPLAPSILTMQALLLHGSANPRVPATSAPPSPPPPPVPHAPQP
jgi:hypothetical protein